MFVRVNNAKLMDGDKVRVFWRCKDCKAAFATEHESRVREYSEPYQGTKTERVVDLESDQIGRIASTCPHCQSRRVKYNRYVERQWVTYDSPCDGRCTNATGHNCECSCGGVNHGTQKVIGHKHTQMTLIQA